MHVYLAGGMDGDWQDTVMRGAPQHTYFDPRTHELTDPLLYTRWDLSRVAQADVVFAYIDDDNPSGIGMSAEIGYAYALGKIIILADRASARKYNFIRAISDITCSDIQTLIEFLGGMR